VVKLIIFDIGGVLLDFSEDEYIAYIAHKVGISEKEFKTVFKPLLSKMEKGFMTVKEMERTLAKHFDIPLAQFDFGGAFKKLAKLNRNVISLAKRLSRHYKVVLLTNVSFERYSLMRRMLLRKLHFKTFASCYLHIVKPSRRIYEHVLKRMNTKAGDALFIDNMAENVEGAKKIGISAIKFTSYEELMTRLIEMGIKVD